MTTTIKLAATLFALAAAPLAQAATVIAAGSYAAGESVFQSDAVGLGPGRYRFDLTLTRPAAFVDGEVTKQTNYVDFCDPDGSGTLVMCGSDSVPTSPLLDPVTPTLYRAFLTVDAPYSVTYADGARTDYFDDCCTYRFEIQGGDAGSYTFAVSVVPEPASWALLIVGIGAVGAGLRRREQATIA